MDSEESKRWQPIDGFPAVAAFIARDPDHETYVFRKFKKLSARTLLHLQSELVDLEAQLHDLDREAARSSDTDLSRSMRNWEVFKDKAQIPDRALMEGKRKKLFEEIQETLHRYHETLVLESEVAKLEGPSDRVLEAYVNDFKGGKKGDDLKLGGRSEEILDDRDDLVALKHPQNKDVLSRLLLNNWPFPTQDLSSNRSPSDRTATQARHFEEKVLLRIVNIFSTAIAAFLLIGSILTLYLVKDPDATLGLVIMFIIIFAVGLSLTTSASRDSMFAATAGYAAVLLVFVSGNLGNAKKG